jgi:hypothetical protein
MSARPLLRLLPLAAVLLAGCGRRTATRDDCRQILDRLVDLELQEKGFRDPALAARWRAEAESRHASDLAACEGKRLPRGAMACVRAATSSEEINHRCLE